MHWQVDHCCCCGRLLLSLTLQVYTADDCAAGSPVTEPSIPPSSVTQACGQSQALPSRIPRSLLEHNGSPAVNVHLQLHDTAQRHCSWLTEQRFSLESPNFVTQEQASFAQSLDDRPSFTSQHTHQPALWPLQRWLGASPQITFRCSQRRLGHQGSDTVGHQSWQPMPEDLATSAAQQALVALMLSLSLSPSLPLSRTITPSSKLLSGASSLDSQLTAETKGVFRRRAKMSSPLGSHSCCLPDGQQL